VTGRLRRVRRPYASRRLPGYERNVDGGRHEVPASPGATTSRHRSSRRSRYGPERTRLWEDNNDKWKRGVADGITIESRDERGVDYRPSPSDPGRVPGPLADPRSSLSDRTGPRRDDGPSLPRRAEPRADGAVAPFGRPHSRTGDVPVRNVFSGPDATTRTTRPSGDAAAVPLVRGRTSRADESGYAGVDRGPGAPGDGDGGVGHGRRSTAPAENGREQGFDAGSSRWRSG